MGGGFVYRFGWFYDGVFVIGWGCVCYLFVQFLWLCSGKLCQISLGLKFCVESIVNVIERVNDIVVGLGWIEVMNFNCISVDRIVMMNMLIIDQCLMNLMNL